jgi:predicted  nucleic acid-binding Zn-ribbon protein
MDPDLERLVRLQELENVLRRLRTELAEAPGQRGALEDALVAERGRLEEARSGLDESQKLRRHKEGQLQDLEAKRSKYKGQLMDVKTNKEYTAMLHEIETVEREIGTTEDQILTEMERADELKQRVAMEEGRFAEAAALHQRETSALDERVARLESEAARVQEDRDQAAAALPEELRERFERVAGLRGQGVVEAADGMCTGCRVKLRLQFYVELKRNDAVRQCEACSRVLYYTPPAPEVAPVP